MFNWVKTAILMAAIMALFGIVGGMIGGQSGMLMALVFGGAMNLFSYWFSDTMGGSLLGFGISSLVWKAGRKADNEPTVYLQGQGIGVSIPLK